MGAESKIQWTDHTWNVARGCTKVDEDCKYCLDGNTNILMADFTWRKLRDLKEGDQLLSVEEYTTGKYRTFVTASVEGIATVKKQAFELSTEAGSVVCSADHPFFTNNSKKWVEPKNMRISQTELAYVGFTPNHDFYDSLYAKGYVCGLTEGDGTFRYAKNWGSVWRKESPQCYWRIALIDKEPLERTAKIFKDLLGTTVEITPFYKGSDKHKPAYKLESRSQAVLERLLDFFHFRADPMYLAGYLAGMFDAEGNMSFYKKGGSKRLNALRITQIKNPDIIGRIKTALDYFGFQYSYDKSFTINGGLAEKFRFFQLTTPAILRKMGFDGTRFLASPALLNGIKALGEQELYDIQTSSRTFIANGFVTHNCYMYRDSLNATRYDPLQIVRTKTVFDLPLRLKEPARIFTSSLTDFFHEAIDPYRHEAWDIIRRCPQHTFQILTKRPERIGDHLPEDWEQGYKNVWLGTSVGSQKAEQRIIDLVHACEARVKFLSLEPLHGPVDLASMQKYYEAIRESFYVLPAIDWVIVGGESGNEQGKYRYRPCELEWIEKIVSDCRRNNIPVFVKQLGTHLSKQLKLKDRHGGNMEEWPEHLRVREFPFLKP